MIMEFLNLLFFVIYDFLNYFKYFIYFNIFLFSLFLNYLSYKLLNEFNFVNCLYFSINLNGCFLIKLSQWVNTQLHAIDFTLFNNYELIKIRNLFDNFFENCQIHDINYTKKIFKNDTGYNFDTIIDLDNNYNIKSGSIAQVYKGKFKKNINPKFEYCKNENLDIAIKVVHPQIKYQIFFPKYLIYIYQYFVKNYKCFKNYDTIFNCNSFIQNLKLQFDMNNEYTNINYFYNYYNITHENQYIVIPKPIMASKNILIMEYIDGILFDEIDLSENEKKKICGLFSLFIKDNCMFTDYFHNDIHNANWKIIKTDDFYKLVIYDFGYIIKNNLKDNIKKIMYYFDTNNKVECARTIYDYVENKFISCEDFIQLFLKHVTKTLPYNDEFLIQIYNFLYINNFKMIDNLLEFFILMILIRKNLKKYFMQKNNLNKNEINYHFETYLFYKSIINKYNIFKNIDEYFDNYYFNNPNYLKLLKFNDKYLENLKIDNSNNNIDI